MGIELRVLVSLFKVGEKPGRYAGRATLEIRDQVSRSARKAQSRRPLGAFLAVEDPPDRACRQGAQVADELILPESAVSHRQFFHDMFETKCRVDLDRDIGEAHVAFDEDDESPASVTTLFGHGHGRSPEQRAEIRDA